MARDVLSRAEAEARAARVGDVAYELRLNLSDTALTYTGEATVMFAVASLDDPLFIDYKGQRITRLAINGRDAEVDLRDNRLWLPADRLEARNTVTVAYENEYDHTGDGFHRFVDPEDGSVYVYTNFQPFAAHRLFPCFDQPDLKATFDLEVVAPSEWAIISASREIDHGAAGDGLTRRRFETTARFATYLLALVGGPWESVHDDSGEIPFGLYTRRSLMSRLAVDAGEIFEITRQGFAFYSELFDQPYPFTKYDQLFMPEFNVGAMENVGAVTIHDGFVFRDPPTDTQRLDRAEVILHELAHMWFGNLVTMLWWDDLWLNESFATYISFLALTRATRFTSAWRTFNAAVKLPAYRADQLPTTHPISADATDTETALLNFDDITYGKGASVLKQLVATIGEDGFREGMRTYFRTHAWGNATLHDFLSALEQGSGRELELWAQLWLETASLNTIAATVDATGDRIEHLGLTQSAPPDYPTLRPHTMEIALVHGNGALRIDSLPARIEEDEISVPAADGLPLPLLVFPNHGDHDYALTSLDDRSVDFALERIHELDDRLLRQLLFTALWHMVWDVRLPSTRFLEAARHNLPHITDDDLTESVLGRSIVALGAYVPDDMREAEARKLLEVALDAIGSAPTADSAMIWMRAAIGVAASPEHLEPLFDLVDGRARVDGLQIDQDMRWALAIKGVAFGSEESEERVAAERLRDPSDRGQRSMIRAAAARPTAEAKRDAWETIHGDGYGSYHLTRAAMQGFQSFRQRELLRPYRDRFFDEVRGVFAARDHPFARSYLLNLSPDLWAEPEVLARAIGLRAELDPEEQALSRLLAEKIDDLDRAIRARELAGRVG
jgi:aminopeptidase N